MKFLGIANQHTWDFLSKFQNFSNFLDIFFDISLFRKLAENLENRK